jgi:predicted transcriptional regulator
MIPAKTARSGELRRTITLRVADADIARLQRIAGDNKVATSDVIRVAIADYFDRQPRRRRIKRRK